ncbi:hypothetical protein AB0L50_37530 [Streptomyces flaveolus]|uniref:hypothetical protein n=1 Tax=Streptomyces flaveolus TaxID=67297 RepID=UPI00342822C2
MLESLLKHSTLHGELLLLGVPATPFVLFPAIADGATAEDWLDPAWGAPASKASP